MQISAPGLPAKSLTAFGFQRILDLLQGESSPDSRPVRVSLWEINQQAGRKVNTLQTGTALINGRRRRKI